MNRHRSMHLPLCLRPAVAGMAIAVTMMLCFAFARPALAGGRLVILPPADLSQELNGVALHLENHLARYLRKGTEIVPQDKVMAFLSRHRIRQTGVVTAATLLLAAKELAADYLLVANVCEHNLRPPTLGITATLYRTADAAMIWSDTAAAAAAERQRLLKPKEDRTPEDLLPTVLDRLFARLPTLDGANATVGYQLASLPAQTPTELLVESSRIVPPVVRPGERVRCIVRLRPLLGPPPKIYIKVAGTIYQARMSSDDNAFEVGWVAPQPTSRPARVATRSFAAPLYRGVLDSEPKDDVYPVTLELLWPDNRRRRLLLGSYRVDSAPPRFALLPKGKRLGGIAAFRQTVPIRVKWERPEPTAHWTIKISNATGKAVLIEEGNGDLPRLLAWNGMTADGPAAPGRYTFAVTATDRAGNTGSASTSLLYQPSIPPPAITACANANSGCVAIDIASPVPLTDWRLELWTPTGELERRENGTALPITLSIDEAMEIGELRLRLTDALGNRLRTDIGRQVRQLLTAQADATADTPTEDGGKASSPQWIEDF